MKKTYVLAMILAIFTVSCGPRGIRYTAMLNNIECTSSRSVAIAILDERPYILNKEKDPSYVGLMRGGYGNPFSQWTESGAPLADDMLTTVADSLRSKGFAVTPLKTSTADSKNSVMSRFAASGVDRLIMVNLKEWYSDYLPKAFIAERSNLFLKVEFAVFDQSRRRMATKNLQEDISLPSGWPEDTVPDVYQKKITQLIDDPKVCRSLR